MEESGSDEKTGSAIALGKRVCSISPDDIGLPSTTRLSTAPVLLTRLRLSVLRAGHEGVFGVQHD